MPKAVGRVVRASHVAVSALLLALPACGGSEEAASGPRQIAVIPKATTHNF